MAIVLWAVCVAFLAHLWMKSGFYRTEARIIVLILNVDSVCEKKTKN
jgi:hypothetical protein